MKSIKIVSSYSDSCGNAYFTKVLESDLRLQGFDASCAELNLDLTQSIEPEIRKKANKHITELCTHLSRADGVNIQLETGLFGTYPGDTRKRIEQMLDANKNTSVTVHSPRITGNPAAQRNALKSAIRGRFGTAFKEWLSYKESSIPMNLNRDIIKSIVRRKMPIIAHTERAKNQIREIFGYENVMVHPLKFVSPGHTADHAKLRMLRTRFAIRHTDTVIGMFGYINEYKGHTLALEALAKLPKDYKLMIFGRIHPQTIKLGERVNPYLEHLQHLISMKKLDARVYFIGEQSTEDFLDYAATVDVVWLPYIEVGQDGSGIASICCDVSHRVLASSSFAFDELFKLIDHESIERFDIGNAIELAGKTRFQNQAVPPSVVVHPRFTTVTQARL